MLGILGAIIRPGHRTTAIVLGGSPGAFLDLPSVLIVIGGTFGVTTACFSVMDMLDCTKVQAGTIFRKHKDAASAAMQMLQLSQIARYRGVLVDPELHQRDCKANRCCAKGLEMVDRRHAGRRGRTHHAA